MSDSFVTPWTVAHQAPLCMGFPRQEYRSGLPFPSSGDLPSSGIKPESPCLLHWQVDSLPLGPLRKILVSMLSSNPSVSGKDCLSVMSRQRRTEKGKGLGNFCRPRNLRRFRGTSVGYLYKFKSSQSSWKSLRFSSQSILDSRIPLFLVP